MEMREVYDDQPFPIHQLEFRRWWFVYRYYDEAGELLYIGSTGDPILRWAQHRRTQPWADQVSTVSMRKFAYEDLARSYEDVAIKTENPKHNVRQTKRYGREISQRFADWRAQQASDVDLEDSTRRLP